MQYLNFPLIQTVIHMDFLLIISELFCACLCSSRGEYTQVTAFELSKCKQRYAAFPSM